MEPTCCAFNPESYLNKLAWESVQPGELMTVDLDEEAGSLANIEIFLLSGLDVLGAYKRAINGASTNMYCSGWFELTSRVILLKSSGQAVKHRAKLPRTVKVSRAGAM